MDGVKYSLPVSLDSSNCVGKFEKEELLEVHGMGFKKYEQYGAVFLDKIQEVTAGDKKGYGISEDADGTDAVQNQNPLDIGPFGSVEN